MGKVGGLGLLVGLAVVILIPFLSRLPGPQAPNRVAWWALAPLFYLAELAVVHFRLRRDAHSFSLSEIPTVIALFIATPPDLLLASLIGGAVALGINRRQRGIKLWFNLIAFAAQGVAAILVFRSLVSLGDPLGPWGWLGAFAGTTAALLVGNTLISAAIGFTGGHLDEGERRQVLLFGLGAGAINTGLALITVTIIWLRPGSIWLAILPAVLLFIAYRAYTQQREERARIEALHDVTLGLHQAPMIEDAVVAAAVGVQALFEVEAAVVLIFPDRGGESVLQTTVRADGSSDVMKPTPFPRRQGRWGTVLASRRPELLVDIGEGELPIPGYPNPARAIVAPLVVGGRLTGVIMAVDPLSRLTSFNERDVRLLDTVATRVSVSLENGRLEDSLREVTRLKERLEELVKSKDQFIASISHELRTPLTGVIGLAQELRNSREVFGPEEIDEFLGHIFEQSSELGNIVEDLLVAAGADTGGLVVKPVPIELRTELEKVLATQAARSGSTVDPVPRGEVPMAIADPLRLRQILRNLITNANRYGGPSVWVAVASRGNTVTVAVVDNGAGVPASSVGRIFEPYGRGDNAVSNPSSVGLGLAVSRQLARLMGGDLIYRREGNLTRFELTLPVFEPGIRLVSAG